MDHDTFHKLQRLDDKVVIVTGAAGLLGRRFCEGYAELGARIAALDLADDAVEEVAAAVTRRHGQQALAIACDITQPEAVDAAVGEVVATLGAVDVLHNNAASKGSDVRKFFAPFEEYPLQTWREVMSVNVDGMFLVAQRVGREMIARGAGGSVIQTSSIYGLVGPDPRIYAGSDYLGGPINTPAVYSTSKAAVIGLTRHLATCWAPHRIRVNCIVPGGVESGQNRQFVESYAARVPLGRMARPEEIVGVAMFLASDAASYVTGQVIAVDGGLTAW